MRKCRVFGGFTAFWRLYGLLAVTVGKKAWVGDDSLPR